MIKTKDGYAKLVGTTYYGSNMLILLSNGGIVEYSTSSKGSTLVLRNSSLQIYATYFNSAISDEALTDIGSVYVRNTSDSFIRRISKSQFYSIIDGKFVTLDTALTITGSKVFTTPIGNSYNTGTYLNGNKKGALIYSTAGAGSYVMLFKGNSTNGYFTHGTYLNKYLLGYTSKATVDEGNNTLNKLVTLLDESGNSSFPGKVTVSGTISGNILESRVATGTKPLNITSTTLVTNLNSDRLDNYHETAFPRLVGVKSGTWNWNDLTRAGYYKIQGGTISNHPSGVYPYGMALVITTENHADGENREVQIYYPHSLINNIAVWVRMHNSSTQGNGWGLWRGIPNTDGVTKIKVTLHITNNTNYPVVWSNQNNTNTGNSDLFKSWNHLYYNPSTRVLTSVGGLMGGFLDIATGDLKITSTTDYRKIQTYDSKPLSINPEGNNVGIGLTNPSYKLHVNGTLRATNTTVANLFVNTGDSTLKIYSGKASDGDGKSDGNICFQTSIDATDGQTHEYPTHYQNRCNISLLPRGGQVYIGTNPSTGNTSYKLYVNGNSYSTGYVSGNTLTSRVATGTAPLNITSTTLVNNLNVDLLDNWHRLDFCRTYNNNKTYGCIFATGGTDNSWKKIFSLSVPTTGTYKSCTVKGTIYYAAGNHAQSYDTTIPFEIIFYLVGDSPSGHRATLYLPKYWSRDVIHVVKVSDYSYEILVRQENSYHQGYIYYQFWNYSCTATGYNSLQTASSGTTLCSLSNASVMVEDSSYTAIKLLNPHKLWGQSFDGTADVNGCVRILANEGNYSEGIRIKPYLSWSTIVLGGNDLTENSGTSTNSWSIHNNNGNFYINRKSSNSHTGYELSNVGGKWGIGTVSPSLKLHVEGNTYISGELQVGPANGGPHTIRFGGTTGDANNLHTFISERIWSGGECSELLLFKGNDVGNGTSGTSASGSGPDRIRHIAASHVFLSYTSALSGDINTVANSSSLKTLLDLSLNRITSSVDIYTGTIYASDWFRSTGNTGWYSQTYGGGWYMQDTTWIRTYSNKGVLAVRFDADLGLSGSSWHNGNGAFTVRIHNNSNLTPILLAYRNGTNDTGANRLFALELLNSGSEIRFGMGGKHVAILNNKSELTASLFIGNLSGYASSAGVLNLLGETGSSTGTSLPNHVGMELYLYYNSGNGPTTYGNFLRIRGNNGGCGELFLGWQGNNNTGGIWYKSKRDVGSWGAWRTVAFTDSTVANADNADKLDGLHANSFMRGTWSSFDYFGMANSNGSDQDWIRTTKNGIIPYESGTCSSLGTEYWRFESAYIDRVVGDLQGNANSAHMLLPHYNGGQLFNPSTYFGGSIGLKVAMTGVGSSTMGSHWTDTLWINGYSGGDVKGMCALHFSRQNGPRFAISNQNFDSSSYGTCYEVWTTYNLSGTTLIKYWAKYCMYLNTIRSKSGNYDFISSTSKRSTGKYSITVSFPSGYNDSNTIMLGLGRLNDHVGNSSESTLYVTILNFSGNKYYVNTADDPTTNDGLYDLIFLCL